MLFRPVTLLTFLTVFAAEGTGAIQCKKDTCLSAVSNKPPRAPGCRAFLASTVTPAIVTVTATPSGTKIPPHNTNACPAPKKSSPSRVPRYASACSNVSAYSSACLCLGARPVAKTLQPCTTTIVAKPTSSTSKHTSKISSSSSSKLATSTSQKSTSSSKISSSTSTKYSTLHTTSSSSRSTLSSSSTTTASTPASSTPAPSTCNNQGLAWGYWYNPYPHNSTRNGWPNYDPEYTDWASPQYTGVVSSLVSFFYPFNQSSANFYDQFTGSTKNFTLNHQGYIWAPRNGTYKFKVSGVDNNFNLWLGDTAFGYPYEIWDRQNSNLDTYVTNGVTGAAVYETNFTGGTWNTFRYTLAQASGIAGLNFHVYDPEGEDMFPPDSISPNLIQQACYGAPEPGGDPYLPFGYNYEKQSLDCDTQSGCLDDYGSCIAPGCNLSDGKCVPLGQGCNNTLNCESMSGCIGPGQQCISPGCYQGTGANESCVPLGQSGCNTPVPCTDYGCY